MQDNNNNNIEAESPPEIDDVSPSNFEVSGSDGPPLVASSNNSVRSTGSSNPRRQRKPRAAPKSQAKRRLEAMATSIDHKLAGAFIVILLLYAVITFGTWVSLEAQPYRSEVFELTHHANRASQMARLVAENQQHLAQKQQMVLQQLQNQKDNLQESNRPHLRQEKQPLPADAAVGLQDGRSIKVEDITDIETLQHTFPVHAGRDLEMIDHPGIYLADTGAMKKILQAHAESMPADGKMAVPKFWKPTCYGPGGVREFLGHHGEQLITPEQAAKVGSYNHEGLETIFIAVASYRDPECQPTVEDMFLRADHPERLRVAVVDQRVESDDSVPPCGQPVVPCSQNPEQALCKYAHLIDVYEVPAILSGVYSNKFVPFAWMENIWLSRGLSNSFVDDLVLFSGV
jgi:hypothetical protein